LLFHLVIDVEELFHLIDKPDSSIKLYIIFDIQYSMIETCVVQKINQNIIDNMEIQIMSKRKKIIHCFVY